MKAGPVFSGILLINKPRGMTSFGVVSRLRRLTGVRRIGHCGTLDPFAEGLLPVCVGRATAAVQFMDSYDKTYRVTVAFGLATDTMDLTGQPVYRHCWQPGELEALQRTDFADIRAAVAQLVGDHLQTPPMYSAVKLEGRPLYAYARSGQTVERAARPIRISAAHIHAIACQLPGPGEPGLAVELSLTCSKGTYIRVIADDLGRQLGFGAHASRLIRERTGPYHLNQALDLAALLQLGDDLPDTAAFWQHLQAHGQVHAILSAFTGYPVFGLTALQAQRLVCGQPVTVAADVVAQRRYVLMGPSGLVAIGHFLLPADTPATQTQAAATPAADGPATGMLTLNTDGQAVPLSAASGPVASMAANAEHPPAGAAIWKIQTERVFVDLGDYRQS